MDAVAVYDCTRCEHQSRDFWRLIKHYHIAHSFEPNFTVVCGVENCEKYYSNVEALCKHMRYNHLDFYRREMVAARCVVESAVESSSVNAGESLLPDSCSVTEDCTQLPCVGRKSETCSIDTDLVAANHVASWSLKLREFDRISGSACEDIRRNATFMLSASRELLAENVNKRMVELNVAPAISNAVLDVLAVQTPYELACHSLASEYQVNKYVEKNFPYVQPVEYKLKSLGEVNHKKVEHMQYISVLETLKVLLQNDNIFSSVLNSHKSPDERLRDFCDGSYHQHHPLFSADYPSLELALYYDDFCIVNPLGHRAKFYKISAFYFMLTNVKPKDRSRLHTINLAAICFSSSLKKYGFDEILKPLITDLITLAKTGVTVVRPDGTFTFKGSLSVVIADNLAAHSIGGFLESFTTKHPCRFCMIHKDKLKKTFTNDLNLTRSEEAYNSQVLAAGRDKSFQSIYGIKGPCCLNVIPDYHVVSGMPSDIMHDFLEGVACDVIQCVIQYCLESGFVNMKFINNRIANFPYRGSDKVNKPDILPETKSSSFKFRQTAAKCRCILRLLPAMIGHKVPEDDKKWEVLLLLLDVHDLAFSPVLSEADTFLLDSAVELFLLAFTSEFPFASVKPKMHYMVHYGSQCRQFGPLINYWSFRFEGKHGYFKDVACRMKCRKNVLLTLAKKHQYYHSFHLQGSGPLLHDENVSHCSGQQVMLSSLPLHIQTALKPMVGSNAMVFRANSVDVDGVTYANELAVITGKCNEELLFSLISGLFVIGHVLYIVANRLNNQEYLRHFHMYSCGEANDYHILSIADLVDALPLTVYKSSESRLCVSMRHNVSTENTM